MLALAWLVLALLAAAPRPAAALASFNLTWGELREAMGGAHAPRVPGASLDDLVPACADWHATYSPRRPNEPSLCITHGNCTRASCHLLFELDEAVTDRPTTVSPPLYTDKPSQSAVWGWGVLSVAVISLSGIFGGLLWPVLNSRYYSTVMRFLIGLAAGSLTATSIFQLIPESLNLTQPGSQSHLDTGLIMLTSIWLLYFGETACKIFFSHDKAAGSSDAVAGLEKGAVALKDMAANHHGDAHFPEADGLLHAEAKKKGGHGHSHGGGGGEGGGGLAAVAWMVVLGDGLHNFVDGMSIGAGYTQSIGTGVSISLAIACEEFPHELGDFAILINSGVSFKRALALNFGSACTAFGGLVLGVVLGEVQYSYLIFAFAGGLFLYIALGSLTPELKTMVDEELESKGRASAALALSLQLLGVAFGATALYLITRYNDSIRV